MIAEPKSSVAGLAEWAAEQLSVPPDSSPQETTSAFLRRLAEEDFVPPPALRMAWEIASARWPAQRSPPAWLDEPRETELRGRIEQFAGQFFNLPPEQRKAQWERLAREAEQWPRLEIRLRRLEPGLNVDFKPLPKLGLREAKLIQLARELFPLAPEARAVRRRQLLHSNIDGDIRPWQKAAARLRRWHREVADLAPDLLIPLATWRSTMRAAAKSSLVRGDANGSRTTFRRTSGGSRWWMVAPIMLVVSAVISELRKSTQDNPWQRPPYYSTPSAPPVFSRDPDAEREKLLREIMENARNHTLVPSPESPPRAAPDPDPAVVERGLRAAAEWLKNHPDDPSPDQPKPVVPPPVLPQPPGTQPHSRDNNSPGVPGIPASPASPPFPGNSRR